MLRLMIMLALVIGATSCKECKQCDELPSEVTHLQGEWEWYLTRRGSELGINYHSDYITPASTNSTVRVIFDNDGCMRFYVNEAEYHACVDYYEHQFYDIPGELSNYECAESNRVILTGDDLDISAKILIYGPSCSELDTLKGPRVPFNEYSAFLTPPPLPVGHELHGYTNFYKRIR